MERKINKKGLTFLIIGLLFISVAVGWYVYNIVEDNNAGKSAIELLEKIEQQGKQEKDEAPIIIVEGDAFCGKVIIEKLDVELPVYDQWDYARLKNAPCRFTGSIQTNNIIIAAHNYRSHFGNLSQLKINDEILFIDPYGSKHKYSVKEMDILDGSAVTDMRSGEWDFTLFTCTQSGEQRITVRCDKK